MTLRESAKRVQDELSKHDLNMEVVEFSGLTRTSEEAANTIGCEVGQIAKTLIFKGKTSGKAICVIASGKNRVCEKKIKAFVGEAIERPNADFVLEQTGFAIGGIPPVGYQLDFSPIIDVELMEYDTIWAAAGTPFAVFQMHPSDLLKITNGKIEEIKK